MNRSLGTMNRTTALEKIREELGMGHEEAKVYYNEWRRRTRRVFGLVGLMFILFGGIIIGRNAFRIVRAAEINRGVEGLGQVVRVVQQRRAAREYFHTFKYEYEGETYRQRSRAGIRREYVKNSDVPIKISGKNPDRAEILDTVTGRVYLETGMVGWSVICLIVGGLTIWVGVLKKESGKS